MAAISIDDLSDTFSYDDLYAFNHDDQGRRVIAGPTPLHGLDLEFAKEDSTAFLNILLPIFDSCQKVIQGHGPLRARYDFVTSTKRVLTATSTDVLRSRLLSQQINATFNTVLSIEDLYETISCLVTLFSK